MVLHSTLEQLYSCNTFKLAFIYKRLYKRTYCELVRTNTTPTTNSQGTFRFKNQQTMKVLLFCGFRKKFVFCLFRVSIPKYKQTETTSRCNDNVYVWVCVCLCVTSFFDIQIKPLPCWNALSSPSSFKCSFRIPYNNGNREMYNYLNVVFIFKFCTRQLLLLLLPVAVGEVKALLMMLMTSKFFCKCQL